MSNKFEPNPYGRNLILDKKGFFISYNADPGGDIATFRSDNGSEETALYNRETDKYFILNGDFREDYLRLADKGYDACYEFYLSKKEEYQSSWSSDF